MRSVTQESQNVVKQEDEHYYKQIFTQISYTHFVELIQLPPKEELIKFIESELKNI